MDFTSVRTSRAFTTVRTSLAFTSVRTSWTFITVRTSWPFTTVRTSWTFPLNSLAVRVPHNVSRRVSVQHAPDPWAGCPVARLPAVGFTVKPMVFSLFCIFP